jgi:hypothetical protein
LTASSSDVPDTVFVKLQPFAEDQRKFLRQIGLAPSTTKIAVP